jgi:hypothetical protein
LCEVGPVYHILTRNKSFKEFVVSLKSGFETIVQECEQINRK